MIDDINFGSSEDLLPITLKSFIDHLDSVGKLHKFKNRYEQYEVAKVEGKKEPSYFLSRSWKYRGKILSLQYNRNYKCPHMPEIMIGVKLCQFRSFTAFNSWFKELTGDCYGPLYFKAEIYRLDPCFYTNDFTGRYLFLLCRRYKSQADRFDTYGSFETDKWEARTISHKNGSGVIYWAIAYAEHIVGRRTCIGLHKVEAVRFEDRIRGKRRMPISTLSEFEKLEDWKPFTFPSGQPIYIFYKWNKFRKKEIPQKDKARLKPFFKEVKDVGMQRSWNKYRRTRVRESLRLIQVNIKLDDYFKKSLRNFIKQE